MKLLCRHLCASLLMLGTTVSCSGGNFGGTNNQDKATSTKPSQTDVTQQDHDLPSDDLEIDSGLVSLKLKRICSNGFSDANQTNFVRARQNLAIKVFAPSNHTQPLKVISLGELPIDATDQTVESGLLKMNLTTAGIADGAYDLVICDSRHLEACSITPQKGSVSSTLGLGVVGQGVITVKDRKLTRDSRLESNLGSNYATAQRAANRKLYGSQFDGMLIVSDTSSVNPTEDCDEIASPLIINLNPEQSAPSVASERRFDLRAEGKTVLIKEQLSDAQYILALDLNHNGQIDSGAELFGDATKLSHGGKATNGFEALKQYDTNHDEKIDANDQIFKTLVLWQFKTGPKVFHTLHSKQVRSIDLKYQDTRQIELGTGNQVLQTSSIEMNDGSHRPIVDLWFKIWK